MTTSPRSSSAPERAHTTALQTAAKIVGAVFLLVGVLGFIPGVTSD